VAEAEEETGTETAGSSQRGSGPTSSPSSTGEGQAGGQGEVRPLTRRRLSTIVAGGLLTQAAMAGCGVGARGGADGGAAAQGTPRGGGGALSGRIQWQARTGTAYAELAQWAAGELKKRHPNVSVEVNQENTGVFDKTITSLAAGTGPDVIHGWGRIMAQYGGRGALANLADYVKAIPPADVQDFVKQQWDGMVIPTTNFRYGVPTYVNFWVLYYNRTLFQRRGQKEPTDAWDHNDYAAALRQLTFEDGPKKVWGGFARVDIPDRQYHVQAFGGHYVDPRDLTRTQLDQGPAQQALQWQYDRLWTDKTWAPIDEARRTWQPTAQADGFAQGALATFEDGMDKFGTLAARMAQGSEWNVAPMPKGPNRRATYVTTDSWGLWRDSAAKDAAWALMQLLISKEFYEQQARAEGFMPSRRSVFDAWQSYWKPKLQPSSPNFNFKVIQDGLFGAPYALVDEVYLCQNEAERIQNDALNAILVRNEKTPSYLREVAPQISEAAGSCRARFQ
jgi:multiple sugar transport system substrate-binding protein